MRKITLFILLSSLLIISVHADSTPTYKDFDIVAYRVGGDGTGPFFYVIDALSDSLLNQEQGGTDFSNSKNITERVSNYLGSSEGDPNTVLVSFRMEGTTLGTYYVAASMTKFELDGEAEKEGSVSKTIKTRYKFDNFDITFNDTHTTTDGSGFVHAENYNYDHSAKTGASELLGSSRLTNSEQESTDKIDNSSSYTAAWWTITSDNKTNYSRSSDYWICRGAMKVLIDEKDYVAADNGTYRATVVVEWGTIS